jgi:hypothetical protein
MTELDLLNLARSTTEHEVAWFAQMITINFGMVVAIYYFLNGARIALKVFSFFAYTVGMLVLLGEMLVETNVKAGVIEALRALSSAAISRPTVHYLAVFDSWVSLPCPFLPLLLLIIILHRVLLVRMILLLLLHGLLVGTAPAAAILMMTLMVLVVLIRSNVWLLLSALACSGTLVLTAACYATLVAAATITATASTMTGTTAAMMATATASCATAASCISIPAVTARPYVLITARSIAAIWIMMFTLTGGHSTTATAAGSLVGSWGIRWCPALQPLAACFRDRLGGFDMDGWPRCAVDSIDLPPKLIQIVNHPIQLPFEILRLRVVGIVRIIEIFVNCGFALFP